MAEHTDLSKQPCRGDRHIQDLNPHETLHAAEIMPSEVLDTVPGAMAQANQSNQLSVDYGGNPSATPAIPVDVSGGEFGFAHFGPTSVSSTKKVGFESGDFRGSHFGPKYTTKNVYEFHGGGLTPGGKVKGKVVGNQGVIRIMRAIKGMVFSGVFDKQEVAVKVVSHSDFEEETIAEVKNLRELDHKNIVRYKYSDEDVQSVYIVLEKCDCTLDEFLRNPDVKDKLHPYQILCQMTKGIFYLHAQAIVHRDLKPSNILMCFWNERWVVKISDFGISKKLDSDKTSITATERGTKRYMAPEQMEGKKIARCTDIFSLGLVFHFVLSDAGKHPFGEDDFEIEMNIRMKKSAPDMDSINIEYKHAAAPLIRSMLHLQGKDRPTVEELKAHHIFWDDAKNNDYIQNVSDYLEKENIHETLGQKLEKSWTEMETDVNWTKKFEGMEAVMKDIEESSRWKGIKPLQELLRAMRNWSYNFHDSATSAELREDLGGSNIGIPKLVMSRFPNLLPIVYEVVKEKKDEEEFKKFYRSEKVEKQRRSLQLEKNPTPNSSSTDYEVSVSSHSDLCEVGGERLHESEPDRTSSKTNPNGPDIVWYRVSKDGKGVRFNISNEEDDLIHIISLYRNDRKIKFVEASGWAADFKDVKPLTEYECFIRARNVRGDESEDFKFPLTTKPNTGSGFWRDPNGKVRAYVSEHTQEMERVKTEMEASCGRMTGNSASEDRAC